MEKNFRINPIGLKGNEINERMKQLMGVAPIVENLSRSAVELTKIGPDGKTYGIVRENHEYYIKVSDKTSNVTAEDFKYIGGLQNKKLEAYPTYAKATKQLNLKFNSICESFDIVNTFNVLINDNLLTEGAATWATLRAALLSADWTADGPAYGRAECSTHWTTHGSAYGSAFRTTYWSTDWTALWTAYRPANG